jgi:GTPase SAR1 family protein
MNSNKLTKPAKINVIQEKETPSRFKILVVGDAAVGKSSIIDRYLEGKFDEKYTPTIAVDYRHKS